MTPLDNLPNTPYQKRKSTFAPAPDSFRGGLFVGESSMTETIHTTIDDQRVSTAHPTTSLRFNGGMLEQLWEILDYRDGKPSYVHTEWRKVPSVTEMAIAALPKAS